MGVSNKGNYYNSDGLLNLYADITNDIFLNKTFKNANSEFKSEFALIYYHSTVL